jgi:hypothetical protein
MKYIITEKQLEVIEIGTARGRFESFPITKVWNYFNRVMKKKHKIESFKKYYFKKSGFDKIKIGDSSILSFFDFLVDDTSVSDVPDEFKKEDVILNFTYYIADNYFDLKKGFNINYLKIKDILGNDYFFFDSNEKKFVGMIFTSKSTDFDSSKKTFRITTSSAVKSQIGKGYGTKMYLSVINDVDYLKSDGMLFTGALRMWRDILPKYVNVWASITKNGSITYVEQTPNKRIKNNTINFFIASSIYDSIN